jgi:bacillolysin
MKKILFLISIFSILSVNAATEAVILKGRKAAEKVPGSEIVRLKDFTSIPNYVKFSKGKEIPLNKLESWLKRFYKSDATYGLKLIGQQDDQIGYTHYRYQQTVNGVPVKFGMYIAHVKNGVVESINGELFDNVSTATASMTEASALNSALNYIKAESYKWEIPAQEEQLKYELEDPTATYYPKGELVLISNNANIQDALVLAYVFNIYSEKPFGRKEVYVNAQTGAIVWEENKIHEADVTGNASTLYSGTQTITSDNASGPFRLREAGRGNGIRTYSNGNTTTYSTADVTNGSANWTTPDATLDAHWGAEMTYDYFLNEHGRNSIDGAGFALISHVHHDNNYQNAFWDGQRMTYGDGSGNNTPLTSLDIAGHEIAHGLTSNTANLVYQAESGALNESFSDIFGNSVERVARPSQFSWEVGEDLNWVIRNMANPNANGDPDTYFGTNWASLTGGDNGGVHTNSGVQNFWYYLLSDGGSGTNDNGDAYTVNALGLTDAGRVAFRNLTVYLTSSSQYADARFYAIQSAVDLFGACTSQVGEVTNAWYAVGVGSIYSPSTVSDFNSPSISSCSAPFTVNFSNTSVNGSTFNWDFGDGNNSTLTNPSNTYNNYGTYTVELIADGGSTCGVDTNIKVAYITIDSTLACITTLPTSGTASTETACAGILYDSGGAGGLYGDLEDAQITISPPGAGSVDLNFASFDIEPGSSAGVCDYDYIEIFNGPDGTFPLIGRYCNNNIPTVVSSTSGSITLVFHSDQSVVGAGFEINWSCNIPTQPPTSEFSSDVDTTCTGVINFTDLSTNGPTGWGWDFGDGLGTSTLQNPGYTYGANGLYTVQLTSTNVNGNDVETKTNYIFVDRPAAPTTVGVTICENNTGNISASGSGVLNWYTSATGGGIINTGNTYTTPSLTTTTTYYVEDLIIAPNQNMGKIDNTGSGANFNNQQYLIFDVFQPMEIIDVQTYPGASGLRTIELRNSSGAVLQSKLVAINGTGPKTVTLNFTVMPGTDYQLGLAAATSTIDLFRNDGSVNYPYALSGLASITASSAGTNPQNYYYFFYDWNVKGMDCLSPRAPVTATVQICTGIDGVDGGSEVTSFLNSGNNLELGLTNLDQGNYNLVVLNALGQVVVSDQINVTSVQQTEIVNMQNKSKGLYYVKLYNADDNFTIKLVK